MFKNVYHTYVQLKETVRMVRIMMMIIMRTMRWMIVK